MAERPDQDRSAHLHRGADAARGVKLFEHSPVALDQLAPGITWGGWVVPVGVSLSLVAVMGLSLMFVAMAEFRRTE